MKRFYMAYGSNLNKAQMKERCPNAVAVGFGSLLNYQLEFKSYGGDAYLTIEKTEYHRSVPVVVWEVSEWEERRLDMYEGCPKSYYKEEMEFEFRDFISNENRTEKCFIYIMNDNSDRKIPTDEYLERCRQGCRDFEIYTYSLDSAYGRSKVWHYYKNMINKNENKTVEYPYIVDSEFGDDWDVTCYLYLEEDMTMLITYTEVTGIWRGRDVLEVTFRTDKENTEKFLSLFKGNLDEEFRDKLGAYTADEKIEKFFQENGIEYTYDSSYEENTMLKTIERMREQEKQDISNT